MKKMLQYCYLICCALLLASCEKVVDVQVKDVSPKIVIEGVLTDEDGGAVVHISQTANLNAPNKFNPVTGASVLVKDNEGTATPFRETSPGVYRSELKGRPGVAYSLQVQVGGASFNAVCAMPAAVELDSLYVSTMEMMGEKILLPNVVFSDPAGKRNTYRFVQYRNNKRDKHLFVMDDLVTDGRRNTTTLFQDAETEADELKKGDRLTIELQSIDPAVYDYWYSLLQGATGSDGAASPANPITNIKGGALGYFSAHSVSRKTVQIQ